MLTQHVAYCVMNFYNLSQMTLYDSSYESLCILPLTSHIISNIKILIIAALIVMCADRIMCY